MQPFVRPGLFGALAITLLAACSLRPGGSTGPSAGPSVFEHPSGDAVILRVEWSGGFVPPSFLYTSFPPFSLTGDGRVIVPGAQIDIFPGPALPAANVRRLTEDGIQAVLKEVTATGLFGKSVELLAAQNFVADVGDTIFTLHADGAEVTIRVYGLGVFDSAGSYPGVSADELAANRTLSRLFQDLGNLDAILPATAWGNPSSQPYHPQAIRLLVRNADADAPDESGIGNGLADWPADSDPATFGDPTLDGAQRCGVVDGQEARDWYSALSSANQLTRFVKGEHRYQVTVRFQLPDEPSECPSPAV